MRSFLSLVLVILVLEAIGGLIGYGTRDGINGWYQSADRSRLTPPDWVFGAMWPSLYLLLSIALWSLWGRRGDPHCRKALVALAAQMPVNWAWNPVFFNLQGLWASVAMILMMIAATAYAIFKAWRGYRPAAWLILPYMAWISFALYLSSYIALKN